MITISDLEFRYPGGEFTLQVDALEIAARERVALIGPSGSGKTTLLHLVAGIVTPERGRVEAHGFRVDTLSEEDRRNFRITTVGLVFQEFELLDYLSVLDNLLLPYRISGDLAITAPVRERAAALAERVGIADKLRRRPRQLSQGERQRVAVCRAVLPSPRLILADEPTGNLDPHNGTKVLDLLLELAEENEATLLTVTHDHALLPRFGRTVDVQELTGAAAGGVE